MRPLMYPSGSLANEHSISFRRHLSPAAITRLLMWACSCECGKLFSATDTSKSRTYCYLFKQGPGAVLGKALSCRLSVLRLGQSRTTGVISASNTAPIANACFSPTPPPANPLVEFPQHALERKGLETGMLLVAGQVWYVKLGMEKFTPHPTPKSLIMSFKNLSDH